MTRQQHRHLTLALLFILGAVLIGTVNLPYYVGQIPVRFAGPMFGGIFLIIGCLGIFGVNVWAGVPFDEQLDEAFGPMPSESDTTKIRAIYLLLIPAGLVLAYFDGVFG